MARNFSMWKKKEREREREESLWKIPEPFGASLAPVPRDDCPAVRKHREPWPDTLTLFSVWTGSSLPSSFPPAASFSFPFSPGAGKLGNTGGLKAAHSYLLIPVLLPDTSDLSLLDPRAPLQQEHWATLSRHSLLPHDRDWFTFWLAVTQKPPQWMDGRVVFS